MSLTFEEGFLDPDRAWRSLREVVEVWDHDGLCRYRRLRIPVTVSKQPGKGADGGAHMQLKLCAADWLRARGLADAEMERRYPAGIADAMSAGRRVAFECGWTSPRKLILAAEGGFACVWLPYRMSGEWQPGDVVDALLVMIPHARRGVELRRPTRPLVLAADSSSRFLAV